MENVKRSLIHKLRPVYTLITTSSTQSSYSGQGTRASKRDYIRRLAKALTSETNTLTKARTENNLITQLQQWKETYGDLPENLWLAIPEEFRRRHWSVKEHRDKSKPDRIRPIDNSLPTPTISSTYAWTETTPPRKTQTTRENNPSKRHKSESNTTSSVGCATLTNSLLNQYRLPEIASQGTTQITSQATIPLLEQEERGRLVITITERSERGDILILKAQDRLSIIKWMEACELNNQAIQREQSIFREANALQTLHPIRDVLGITTTERPPGPLTSFGSIRSYKNLDKSTPLQATLQIIQPRQILDRDTHENRDRHE